MILNFKKFVHVVSVAHFLESRGMTEDALEVATDPDYRFELAIQLGRLEVAKVSLSLLPLEKLYSMTYQSSFNILTGHRRRSTK